LDHKSISTCSGCLPYSSSRSSIIQRHMQCSCMAGRLQIIKYINILILFLYFLFLLFFVIFLLFLFFILLCCYFCYFVFFILYFYFCYFLLFLLFFVIFVIFVVFVIFYFLFWPINAQLFHKLSHYYMFRHYRFILRKLVINTLPSYTSISNAAVGNN
jgi:hypothetical protein